MNHNKVFLLSILVLAFTLQACNSNAVESSTPTHTAEVIPTVTASPTRAPVASIPFGSGADIDGMKFMVTNVIRPADGIVSAGDIFNPQPGQYQHYLFISLDIACKADAVQQCHLDLFNIKLMTPDGTFKYPKWFLSGVESILQDTDFDAGSSVTGDVPFIVALGDSRLLFTYESLSGETFYFALP